MGILKSYQSVTGGNRFLAEALFIVCYNKTRQSVLNFNESFKHMKETKVLST